MVKFALCIEKMSGKIKIKSALVSVFYKDNLAPVIEALNRFGVSIYSTGGTQEFIEKLGIKVIPVEDLTAYPSILGGRVKTLHPKIFGGILGRRELNEDLAQLEQYEIPEIDLVIVDLYPFEETLAKNGTEKDCIEKIDIGGISLIRAAAKNYNDVAIVSSRDQYLKLLEILNEKNGHTELSDRKRLAAEAFACSSHYDSMIFHYFNRDFQLPLFRESFNHAEVLRYGENPHQKGVFYGDLHKLFDKISGKELSYNNLLDVDAAVALIDEFKDCTFAILKHNNACGVASEKTVLQAWKKALACDPVSAFGGILITNRTIDAVTAAEINQLFFEVLIAPEFDADALAVLTAKPNRILLKRKPVSLSNVSYRTLLNGVISQDKDLKSEKAEDLKPATNIQPSPEAIQDMLFANKIVKHTKSNTIVIAKDACLISSGTGQTSRVDALKQAIEKAKSFGFSLQGAAMASDAFFPFADCVEIANKEGIHNVIQPGGSIKDKDSVAYCNANNMCMVFTGTRHFKH